MRVVVLAGGYGGARFTVGLRQYLGGSTGSAQPIPPDSDSPDDHDLPPIGDDAPGDTSSVDHDIAVITNTADDIRLHGLHVSPDLDTVMYTLGGGLDSERGWGRADETFRASEELTAYSAGASWFGLGDRDLATHLIRTQMCDAGYSLTQVTEALCKRWQPGARVLPMTDERVETHVIVHEDGRERAIHFQEWWIRYHASLQASGFVQVGVEEARPTDEVISAIADAELIVVAPSNPVVSIGPILAVPGMSAALQRSSAPTVGISPIIGGSPLRGMADKCLAAIGVQSSAASVAEHYGARRDGGLLDAWIIDDQDHESQSTVADLGIRCQSVPTIMRDTTTATALAEETVTMARQLLDERSEGPGSDNNLR